MVRAVEIPLFGAGLRRLRATLRLGQPQEHRLELRFPRPRQHNITRASDEIEAVHIDAAHRLAERIDRVFGIIFRTKQPGFLRRHRQKDHRARRCASLGMRLVPAQ